MKTISAGLLLILTCYAPFLPARDMEGEAQKLSPPETSVEFVDQGTFRVTIAFDRDRVVLARVNDYDLVRLEIEGCRPAGKPGEPLLPRYYLRVLVPPASRYTGLALGPKSSVQLPGEYSLFPAQRPVPGNHTGPVSFTGPDPALYTRTKGWPEETVKYISTGISRGTDISTS